MLNYFQVNHTFEEQRKKLEEKISELTKTKINLEKEVESLKNEKLIEKGKKEKEKEKQNELEKHKTIQVKLN